MHKIPLVAVRTAITYANTLAIYARSRSAAGGMAGWLKNRRQRRFALSVA